jgi:CDP-glycerol glycerophosphotransferase
MKRVSTFIFLIIAQLVYRLAFLFPRSKQTWVCIGWHTGKERELFADNSKYFFLSAQAQCPEVKLVWLARDNSLTTILRDAGFSAYSIHSLKGRFYALRAGYTIIDAYLETAFWQYTGGSKIIQLWHGKGMKKTGYDSGYSTTSRSRFLQPGFFAPLYRLIAASPYTAKLMSSTFRIPLEHIWQTGLPRDDVLFSTLKGAEVDAHLDFHNKVETLRQSGVAKTLFYAPTFPKIRPQRIREGCWLHPY